MSENPSVFEKLYALDVSDWVRQKQNLSYLPWAAAIVEVKKIYPDMSFTVYPQIMDEFGNTRFWHDDGTSGWVDVGVTIEGKEERITLPIMDHRNKPIPATEITSFEANKAQMRCLVKACALHGAGTYVFLGEDLPESVTAANELKDSITSLIKVKCKDEKTTAKVMELCKAAERKAWPNLDDDAITGRNYKDIDDMNILENLEKQLLAIRK